MLTIDQIEPGIVVWLDSDALNADPRVSATGVLGVRPFVCIDVGPGTTTWLALTSRDRMHHNPAFRRIPVHPVDKFNGTPAWREQTNYIRDMAFRWWRAMWPSWTRAWIRTPDRPNIGPGCRRPCCGTCAKEYTEMLHKVIDNPAAHPYCTNCATTRNP